MMNPTAETWAMMTSEFSLRCVFALFHFLWQGTLLGIAVAVAIALLRNEPASVRYWLTATGLFACPLCVAITFCSISPPRETQHRQNSVIAKQVGSNAAGVTNNTKGTSVPQSYLEPNSKPEPLVSVFQKDKFLSVASENLNLLLAKFSGGVFCVYAICVLALLLRLGTGIVGSGRLRLATWTLADPSNFLQPKQSNAMHGLPVQQVEARSVDEANEDLQEIDGITAQLTIKYHIPGGEDTARILVFDDERRTFLGTSDEFYGKKGRINNVENGSEIQFNDLKPGEYHVCRIARAGQYSRTSLDRTTIHLKAGDARSIEITRPSGKHIVGRVVNRNAFQLRHVQVWVCPALDDSIWRFRDATSHNLCGEDGSFTTDLVSPGKYLVFVDRISTSWFQGTRVLLKSLFPQKASRSLLLSN